VDRNGPVNLQTASGRIAFVTANPFVPGPDAGLAGADWLCASEAQEAGLDGSFAALLALQDASAISRFDTSTPWNRADGVVVGNLENDRLRAPIVLTATGSYTPKGYVWSGFRSVWEAGANTCNDWTGGGSTELTLIGPTLSATGGSPFGSLPLLCAVYGIPLWCLQQ
jgi:hypothetical protein